MKHRRNLVAVVVMGLSLFGSGMTVFARESESADRQHGQHAVLSRGVQPGDDRSGRGELARGREMELGDDRGGGLEPRAGQVEMGDDRGAHRESQASGHEMELGDDRGMNQGEGEKDREIEAQDDRGRDALVQNHDSQPPSMASEPQPGDDKNQVEQPKRGGDDTSGEAQARTGDDGNKGQPQPGDDRRGGHDDGKRGKG